MFNGYKGSPNDYLFQKVYKKGFIKKNIK